MKAIVKQTEARIRRLFWEKLSLIVDCPKSGGSGNSNSGNTARRAFDNPEIFAEITGLDYNLIVRLKNILITLSCKFPVNSALFQDYCHETAKVYMDLYPQFPMTATVHKVLIHGAQIMENSLLPLGYFAEDGPEHENKFYRSDRENHARKDSRIHNLTDVFNRHLESLDPIIASYSLRDRLAKNNYKKLPTAVIRMLKPPDFPNHFQPIVPIMDETTTGTDHHKLEDMNLDFIDDFRLDDSIE